MRNATGHLYKRYAGHDLKADDVTTGVFYLRYKVAGCRHSLCLGTTDREQAAELAAEHLRRINRHDRDAYLRSLISLGKLAQAELDGRNLRDDVMPPETLWERYEASRRRPQSGPGTMANYRSHVQRLAAWLAPQARNAAALDPAIAERYVGLLEKEGITAATIRAHLATLARVWRVLMPEARNPWPGLHPSAAHRTIPYRRLSIAEVRRIAQAARALGPEDYTLILIGYYTAMRIGDAATLDAAAFDRKAATLTIVPTKTARRKPAPVTIPVLPELAAALTDATEGPMLPSIAAEQRKRPWHLSERLAKLFRDKAGDTAEGKASFHSLRATFISLMDEAGAPQAITDSVTGHAPRTMHARYSHPDIVAARTWVTKALPRVATRH